MKDPRLCGLEVEGRQMRAVEGGVTAARGFKAAGVRCGVKSSGLDLALICSEAECAAAGVFTTNAFQAAPVVLSRKRLESGCAQAVVANSGNANAITGERGLRDAEEVCAAAAAELGLDPEKVVPASTGIIGVRLPVERIKAGIREAVASLSADGGPRAAEAILTTDTYAKLSAYEVEIGEKSVRVGGIAKGAGMISPNMATMLCFVTTDAAISPGLLKRMLVEAVHTTFNCLTVDGDMSTNDSVIVLANGCSGCRIDCGTEAAELFGRALSQVCLDLAKAIARDGEGATKYVEVIVDGAASAEDAKRAGMAVAKSPLVKTALFGNDPNWGRVLCAVGASGARVEPDKVSLWFGDVQIVNNGEPTQFDLDAVRSVMSCKDLQIRVDLGIGAGRAKVYTCDLSYDYVRINAEYHT
ncbi:MAG: bifunctional glutamate N-acetyltransferase/amino-acid acetyltransferase ArgJ [Armatimonadota bacterium]|nr:bifunctional glutamate N-acetyltransferase/amino-acid acetyltransferase ArgJ [Armatimonadota bacterium]